MKMKETPAEKVKMKATKCRKNMAEETKSLKKYKQLKYPKSVPERLERADCFDV